MGIINVLPIDLANQIAAGEVVERPASVIKELIENAIDAGARRIQVYIEMGGKRLVRVEDDGNGMGPEDARLSLERHATSKIRRADDLAAIYTLGFRGEALPSIASVSHFVMKTRLRGDIAGTEIRVNGGAVAAVQEIGTPEGTSIEVGDLFYNLPARRKFLKTDTGEATQVSRVVTQFALGYHEVGFSLTSGPRTAFNWPAVAKFEDRLYQVFGDRPDLVPVGKALTGISIKGFVAALAESGPTRGAQNVFVNRRIVKDKTIAHAIIDAYSNASIKERSPEVHLFLEIPPERIDVNVHPTKAEVRFRDQSFVHEAVKHAVADAIGKGAVPELQLLPTSYRDSEPIAQSIPNVLSGGIYPSRWADLGALGALGALSAPGAPGAPGALGALGAGNMELGTRGQEPGTRNAEPGTAVSLKPLMPLGQFRDTFIIAVDADGIAIIDQHVAHERVLFERVMQKLSDGRLESQRLLEPMLVDLTPEGRQALLSHAADLDRLGFSVDEFGGETLRVTGVPAVLGREDAITAIRALAEDLEGLDRGRDVGDALRRIAATTACHAAVKANYPLTHEKMMHILEELRHTAYSTVCPHGRPVMLRLTRREIEKNFQRI
ncbi:MAG TPA: DNA mismatch repair endonuclease MutL [Vicinamibacterales bacterium]|nr:DNA mismatch repair endonuclease MutL [Vicinamibacterales bacterium]